MIIKHLYFEISNPVFSLTKLRAIFFVFFLYVVQLVLPINQSDSLLRLLNQQPNKISRIEILNQLYIQYDNTCNYDSALIIADRILSIAKTIDYQQLATACYKKGKALYNSGQYLPAKTMFNKAIIYAHKDQIQLSKSHKIIAKSYNFLSRVSSREADYKQSIAFQRKSAYYYAKINELKNVTNANNEIASQYEALGEYNNALKVYLLNLKYKNEPDCRSSVLQSIQKIAELYAKLYNYKLAYKYLLDGINYADKTNATNSLINLYVTTGNLFLNNDLNADIALSYFFEAKKMYTTTRKDADTKKFDLIIGDAYMSLNKDSMALKYYQNVLKINKQSEQHYLSTAYHKIAMLYKSNKEFSRAIFYFQKSIEAKCTTCPDIRLHPTYIEMADAYLQLKNYSQTTSCLEYALQLAINSKLQYEKLITYEAFARYYAAINNSEKAIIYCNKSLDIANELALPEQIIHIATNLSGLYFAKADYKKSAELLQKANKLIARLKIANQSDQVARLEMKLQMMQNEEKQMLEKLETQNQLKRHRIVFIFSISGLLLLTIIAFLLLKAYRNKRRDNEFLKRQKLEIEDMAQQIHENDASKLRFFTNISHEIRTPLTLIKLPLESLINTSANQHPELEKQLKLALNNTRKLQQILNQLLDLRKLDDNKLSVDETSFELIQFVNDIVASFEPYCNDLTCTFQFNASVSAANVLMDQNKLYTILNNLLSNAFKYNNENGRVWLTLSVATGHIGIEIKDTGKGIDPKHLNEIGTRYLRLNNSIISEGSGIGLAYVKELVSLLNGQLKFENNTPTGTIVTVKLPCRDIKILTNRVHSTHLKSNNLKWNFADKNQQLITQHKNAVLIVEDNSDLRDYLSQLFISDYEVYIANNGIEGKEMAFSYQPDAIISDIMMPGINGIELCTQLKNDIRTSHIPVLLLTAKDTHESELDGYTCGADDYIVKPFDSELLSRKLHNVLKTRANARKLFSFSDSENQAVKALSDIDRKFVVNCRLLIEQNLADTAFNTEVLSHLLGLSSKTLTRKFRSLTGKTPSEFIKHIRMTHALTLLRHQKLRVNEVALMVGYEDTDSFGRAFKLFHGNAPSAFQ